MEKWTPISESSESDLNKAPVFLITWGKDYHPSPDHVFMVLNSLRLDLMGSCVLVDSTSNAINSVKLIFTTTASPTRVVSSMAKANWGWESLILPTVYRMTVDRIGETMRYPDLSQWAEQIMRHKPRDWLYFLSPAEAAHPDYYTHFLSPNLQQGMIGEDWMFSKKKTKLKPTRINPPSELELLACALAEEVIEL